MVCMSRLVWILLSSWAKCGRRRSMAAKRDVLPPEARVP
jgi:hypothetical protein